MSASLKMLQICRSCLKCRSSANSLSNGIIITLPTRSIFNTANLLRRKNPNEPHSGESEDDPLDKTLQSAAEDLSNKISGEKGRHVATDLIQKLKMMKMARPEGEDTNGQQNFGSILSKMSTDQVKHRGEGRSKRRGQRDDNRDNRKQEKALSGIFDDMSAVRYQDSENYDYHAMKRPNPLAVERKFTDRKSPDQRGPRKWIRQPGADRDFKLFEGDRLDIFSPGDIKAEVKEGKETLWDVLEKEELTKLQTAAPKNGFEEMIVWTKQGKLWHFPIDNEQGWELEQKTGFHEHIFLEHLTEDFPKKGPIRQFMNHVVVALSKNAFITAEQKREHIQWFREYFIEKQDILQESLGENGLIRNERLSELEA
ncbi:MRPS31 [Mytilus coruscus]|uniref:Small ribosomal subunit protein mS31 n=1 Tax=Mytilus coruscus TaxID=42192 RepID=A0A6J8AS71_MYTCO|nr:MRPS31 [Mytilus coruscus]